MASLGAIKMSLKADFNAPNNAQKAQNVCLKISYYPKLDPFQAISLAKRLCRTCSANNVRFN